MLAPSLLRRAWRLAGAWNGALASSDSLESALGGKGAAIQQQRRQQQSAAGTGAEQPGGAAAGAAAPREPETPLLHSIRNRIMIRGGPLSVAEYMGETLTNPLSGFYMNRDVFGRGGDFVTSPEISQMFGEMVGIWCVTVWMALGSPSKLRLVELGPGRGTLMADLLRGTAAFPAFASALEIELVELSPALRRAQWGALRCAGAPGGESGGAAGEGGGSASISGDGGGGGGGDASHGSASTSGSGGASGGGESAPLAGVSRVGGGAAPVAWRGALEEVPLEGPPALYIAHEFFDALPVHQFARDKRGRGWLEKMVDTADESDPGPHHLRFVLSPQPTPAGALLVPRRLAALPEEQQKGLEAIEISAQGMATAERLAQRIGSHGGAALIVDYGRAGPPYSDSLVAIRGHKGVPALSQPGTADLSAWVDFGALRAAAEGSGAQVSVHGPVPQSRLLLSLGIQARAQALAGAATEAAQVEALQAAYDRLVGGGAGGMGESYQALAIAGAGLPAPVGFDEGAGE